MLTMIGAPAQHSAAQVAATTPALPANRPTFACTLFVLAAFGAADARALALSTLQQELSPCCFGGHDTLPYEQNTQQSPDRGRSITLQCAHS
jgi:hypothetical protein